MKSPKIPLLLLPLLLFSCASINVQVTEPTPEPGVQDEQNAIEETEPEKPEEEGVETPVEEEEEAFVPSGRMKKIDMTKWLYSAEGEAYYQTGIQYCDRPASAVQKLSVYVPAICFDATANGDGTYTARSNGKDAIFTMDIDTRTDVMLPDEEYSADVDFFMRSKRVLFRAGGKCAADFKAAVRYARYNSDRLPPGVYNLYVYGENRGGEYACALGLSGNYGAFDDALEKMGAARRSDSVQGVYATNPDFSFEIEAETLDRRFYEYSLDRFLERKKFPFQSKVRATALSVPNLAEIERRPRKIPEITAEMEFKRAEKKRDGELDGRFDTRRGYIDALNTLTEKPWILYDELFNVVKIENLDGIEKIIENIGNQESGIRSEESGIRKAESENPFYYLENGIRAGRAKYWVVKSGAFRKIEDASKDALLLEMIMDAGGETFLDLMWEKTENERADPI